MTSKFGHEKDLEYMKIALDQAQMAAVSGEVPIGAVVIDAQGHLIGAGHNRVEQSRCQTAHAESLAIAQACHTRADWRLDGCWLYVTLEPCLMCMGLIKLSRIEGIVFGAASPLFGYRLDNNIAYQLYKDDTITIIEGVRAAEAAAILQLFFKQRRGMSE